MKINSSLLSLLILSLAGCASWNMTDEDPIVVKPSLKIIDFSGRIPEVAFYGSSILFKPDLEYLEEYEPERYDNSFSSYDKSGKHDLKAYPIKAWVIGFDTVHEIPIDESVDGISYISRGYSGGLLVKYRCKNREGEWRKPNYLWSYERKEMLRCGDISGTSFAISAFYGSVNRGYQENSRLLQKLRWTN